MQNLIHPELARSHRDECLRRARRRRFVRGPRAPGLRPRVARALASAAERLDAEAARLELHV